MWYLESARQGHKEAQYALALMYQYARGTKKNLKQAAKWYEKAASAGVLDAQDRLGQLYEKGAGVAQNFKIAHGWYAKAAKAAYPISQFHLGLLFLKGKGVKKDPYSAYIWLSYSFSNGYGKSLVFRDQAASMLSPREIHDAQNSMQTDQLQNQNTP